MKKLKIIIVFIGLKFYEILFEIWFKLLIKYFKPLAKGITWLTIFIVGFYATVYGWGYLDFHYLGWSQLLYDFNSFIEGITASVIQLDGGYFVYGLVSLLFTIIVFIWLLFPILISILVTIGFYKFFTGYTFKFFIRDNWDRATKIVEGKKSD